MGDQRARVRVPNLVENAVEGDLPPEETAGSARPSPPPHLRYELSFLVPYGPLLVHIEPPDLQGFGGGTSNSLERQAAWGECRQQRRASLTVAASRNVVPPLEGRLASLECLGLRVSTGPLPFAAPPPRPILALAILLPPFCPPNTDGSRPLCLCLGSDSLISGEWGYSLGYSRTLGLRFV